MSVISRERPPPNRVFFDLLRSTKNLKGSAKMSADLIAYFILNLLLLTIRYFYFIQHSVINQNPPPPPPQLSASRVISTLRTNNSFSIIHHLHTTWFFDFTNQNAAELTTYPFPNLSCLRGKSPQIKWSWKCVWVCKIVVIQDDMWSADQ